MKDVTIDIFRLRGSGKKKRNTNIWLIMAVCLSIGFISLVQVAHIKRSQTVHRSATPQTGSSQSLAKTDQKTTPAKSSQQPVLSIWHGDVHPVPAWSGTIQTFYKVPTNDPVVFLTIDDGITHDRQILDWLTIRHLPFSLFLDNAAIKDNYAYFRHLQTFGMLIEDHTLTHPKLPTMSLSQQQAEICGAADIYTKVFARRPTLFRPPYGLMNGATTQAATACGMHAIVMWHATVDGGTMHYQGTNHLEPGDIVLMHFKPDFLTDIQAFSAQVAKDHLQIARLEDWLK